MPTVTVKSPKFVAGSRVKVDLPTHVVFGRVAKNVITGKSVTVTTVGGDKKFAIEDVMLVP